MCSPGFLLGRLAERTAKFNDRWVRFCSSFFAVFDEGAFLCHFLRFKTAWNLGNWTILSMCHLLVFGMMVVAVTMIVMIMTTTMVMINSTTMKIMITTMIRMMITPTARTIR